MLIVKRSRALSGPAVGLAALLASLPASTTAQATGAPLSSRTANGSIEAQFEAAGQETRVTGHAAPDLCFSFAMPEEWRISMDGPKARLNSASSHAELDVSLRSARDLRHLPQPDLASRDAALLQQDYEDLLGRPAQSVSLVAASGTARWSATWVDANLPTASQAMTVETFIVPLSGDWVLELSLTNVERREDYDALVRRLLAGLRVQGGAVCST